MMTFKLPILLAIAALFTFNAKADISFDHSAIVPPSVRGQILSGAMRVPASSGRQVGGNLLHSFEQFSVHKGESVTFTADGASAPINNIIGRVTGDKASFINGDINSTIPDAQLYLLNPQGWLFGRHAGLNMPSAIHLSTAASLKFAEGQLPTHRPAVPSALLSLSGSPEAFGFLGQNAEIRFNGTQLSVKDGKTLEITAGNIHLNHAAQLNALTGELRLIAIQGAANITPNAPISLEQGGTIRIIGTDDAHRAGLNVSGNSGGRLTMWGKAIALKNAFVFADNSGAENSSDDNGVWLTANRLTLNNSVLSYDAFDYGKAGNVQVMSKTLSLLNGGEISSSTYALGDAGNVVVKTDRLRIDGQNSLYFTGIHSDAKQDSHAQASGGKAGAVRVVAQDLSILNGGEISSGAFADGDAGNVTVKATDLHIDGQNSEYFTGIHSDANSRSSGNAGAVQVNATHLRIIEGGGIASGTFSRGDAGNVRVSAAQIFINNKNSARFTGISSDANSTSTGKAGRVSVNAERVNIIDGGRISSSTFARGDAGNVKVNATALNLDNKNSIYFTGISSQTLPNSYGNAGSVAIDAKTINIVNGAVITTSTFAQGDAGNVTVNSDTLNINNGNSNYFTGIASNANTGSTGNAGDVSVNVTDSAQLIKSTISSFSRGTGRGGNVSIHAKQLSLIDISTLSASATRSAKSGNLDINVEQLNLNNSAISVESAQNDAGDIHINAKNLLYALHSTITTNAGGGHGNGGNIYIDDAAGRFVVLNHSLVIANAQERGDAGNIAIFTDNFLQSADSIVQASSPFGTQGAINITGMNANIAGSISVTQARFLDEKNNLRDDCLTRYRQNNSSYFDASALRGGVVLATPDDVSPIPFSNCRGFLAN